MLCTHQRTPGAAKPRHSRCRGPCGDPHKEHAVCASTDSRSWKNQGISAARTCAVSRAKDMLCAQQQAPGAAKLRHSRCRGPRGDPHKEHAVRASADSRRWKNQGMSAAQTSAVFQPRKGRAVRAATGFRNSKNSGTVGNDFLLVGTASIRSYRALGK